MSGNNKFISMIEEFILNKKLNINIVSQIISRLKVEDLTMKEASDKGLYFLSSKSEEFEMLIALGEIENVYTISENELQIEFINGDYILLERRV